MYNEEETITIRYRVYAIGDKVRASSPRCELLEPDKVYTVTRYVRPFIPLETSGTVFVEGIDIGVGAEYVCLVEEDKWTNTN